VVDPVNKRLPARHHIYVVVDRSLNLCPGEAFLNPYFPVWTKVPHYCRANNEKHKTLKSPVWLSAEDIPPDLKNLNRHVIRIPNKTCVCCSMHCRKSKKYSPVWHLSVVLPNGHCYYAPFGVRQHSRAMKKAGEQTVNKEPRLPLVTKPRNFLPKDLSPFETDLLRKLEDNRKFIIEKNDTFIPLAKPVPPQLAPSSLWTPSVLPRPATLAATPKERKAEEIPRHSNTASPSSALLRPATSAATPKKRKAEEIDRYSDTAKISKLSTESSFEYDLDTDGPVIWPDTIFDISDNFIFTVVQTNSNFKR